MKSVNLIPAVISNGASLSAAIDLGNCRPVAFYIPLAFEGATLTFQITPDNVNYKNVYDEANTEISITVGVDRVIRLSALNFYPYQKFKIRSGSAGVPTPVAADRTIVIIGEADD